MAPTACSTLLTATPSTARSMSSATTPAGSAGGPARGTTATPCPLRCWHTSFGNGPSSGRAYPPRGYRRARCGDSRGMGAALSQGFRAPSIGWHAATPLAALPAVASLKALRRVAKRSDQIPARRRGFCCRMVTPARGRGYVDDLPCWEDRRAALAGRCKRAANPARRRPTLGSAGVASAGPSRLAAASQIATGRYCRDRPSGNRPARW